MRDEIIAKIKMIAEANGGEPPGRRAFEIATGIGQSAWSGGIWARWSEAVIEAGFEPNAKQGKLDADFVLKKLAESVRHFGKIPVNTELRMYPSIDPEYPSHNTIYNHFGSKQGIWNAVAAWVAARPDFSDVAILLDNNRTRPFSRSEKVKRNISPPQEVESNPNDGLVYLLKSGLHYKIGRSQDLERRIKQIRVALPEAVSLVHAIKTDDPAGIEAYWHRRFADRRANGEWFRLSPADVAAFRRRTFQ